MCIIETDLQSQCVLPLASLHAGKHKLLTLLTLANWRAVVLQKEVQFLLIMWSRGHHVSTESVCPLFW